MYFRTVASIGMAAILGAAIGQAQAADLSVVPSDTNDWTFTGAAYLWAAGIEGQSGVFGFPPQDVDLSFGDVLNNLDVAFMGLGEARNGPLSIGVDMSFAKLGTNVGTPFGIAATDVDVTAKTLMATGIAGYALLDNGNAHLDAIAGARLWSVSTDFDFNGGILNGTSAHDSATWVDPLVGVKFKANVGEDVYLSGWGMLGGFGAGSDLMWDVMGGVGYDWSDSFSLFAGYRAVSVDYRGNGFVYDVVQQGPVLAGLFRF